jgi:hypothetical protein
MSINQLGFLLRRILIFLMMIFVADQAIGGLLKFYYFKQSSGALYRATYSIEKTRAEVLVFGSSRANHHYYPSLFVKRLNCTFYNTGRDATSILYDLAVFKAVLTRYKPKMVILDLNREAFLKDEISYDKLSDLLPYYSKHPEIRRIVDLKGNFEKLKLASAIYPYNSDIITIAAGNLEFNKLRKGDISGYVPIYRVWRTPLATDSAKQYQIDNNKLNAFKEIIHDCKLSGIKLIIVCSPYFAHFPAKDRSLLLAKKISQDQNITFYDYSMDNYFLHHQQLFGDTFHLNNTGAVMFTNRLIDSISKNDMRK